MVALKYVGASQSGPNDLSSVSYLNTLGAANLAQSTVDSLINAGFSGYVAKSYVDTQDALNATKAFVDAGDATRLHLAQIGVPGGVAGLDSGGRVAPARLGIPSTQRFPKPFLSPSAYHTSTVVVTTTASTLYTMSVADPGFTYKLILFGTVDTSTATDASWPRVWVTVGSTSGTTIATGAGSANLYTAGVMTQFLTSSTYTIPTWADRLDLIAVGGGGGGGAGGGLFFDILSGSGGAGGFFGDATVSRGSTLPSALTQLNINIGGGGGQGANGGATTITGSGMTTVTGAGGGAGSSLGGIAVGGPGGAPGTLNFNGNLYPAGTGGAGGGGAGIAPGGGGGGGNYNVVLPGPGGTGASGGAWIFAYPFPNTPPRGPATLLPTPLNGQSALTGATTLYVQMATNGSGNTSATTILPTLWALPVPA